VVAVALERQIARLSKILVDSEGITFEEAQARLNRLTLEVVVGPDATSPAAHAAVLTAISVGSRTFIGGVRLTGAVGQRLNSALPLAAQTLEAAAVEVGASQFEGRAAQRIFIGIVPDPVEANTISVWWQGWSAGIAEVGHAICDVGDNPLPGIACGALAVGAAFDSARGHVIRLPAEVDLWPTTSGESAPPFADVFLPGSLWLVGLGNLGQAFLWALAALPYANPAAVMLVLQDCDRVSEENWATSVLVRSEIFGDLKTKVSEAWATSKRFGVRRVDRRLLASDRLAKTGFDCVVDAGLGRKASDFDRYRVTVFDNLRPIDKHFEGQTDASDGNIIPEEPAYRQLQTELGICGTAEIAGASVAAPHVSAIAAAVAVSRLIAVTSNCPCRVNEVRRLSEPRPKVGPHATIPTRGARHAGRPLVAH
jgi:hypothetical protein